MQMSLKKGAATSEYIILLAVILGIILALYWHTLLATIQGRLDGMADNIQVTERKQTGQTATEKSTLEGSSVTEGSNQTSSKGWLSRWFERGPTYQGTGGGVSGKIDQSTATFTP